MERVEFPRLHKFTLKKGLKSYQLLISEKKLEDARKTIRRKKKKKNLEWDLYFHPTKIEILKIQDSTSPKLVSPTETVSGAPRFYKLPNSLKSLFSPLRNNILRTMKSLEMWEIGSAGLTLIH